MSRKSPHEKAAKIIIPFAAGAGGAAVGGWLRGRAAKDHQQAAERFIALANQRADQAEALAVAERAKAKEAHNQSVRDPLTGLYNLRGLENAYQDIKMRPRSEDERHALVTFDLDDFKKVNDTNGHLNGDKLLSRAARALVAVSRPGDTAARVGGDEMCLLLPRANEAAALAVAERAKAGIEAGGEVTVSIGVSAINPEFSLDENREFADIALYVAKESGKGQIATYSPPIVTD